MTDILHSTMYYIYLSVQENRVVIAQVVVMFIALALLAKPYLPGWYGRIYDPIALLMGAVLITSAPFISGMLTSGAAPAVSNPLFALIVDTVNAGIAITVTASIAVIGLATLAKPLFPRWAAQNQAMLNDVLLGCIIISATDQIAGIVVPI